MSIRSRIDRLVEAAKDIVRGDGSLALAELRAIGSPVDVLKGEALSDDAEERAAGIAIRRAEKYRELDSRGFGSVDFMDYAELHGPLTLHLEFDTIAKRAKVPPALAAERARKMVRDRRAAIVEHVEWEARHPEAAARRRRMSPRPRGGARPPPEPENTGETTCSTRHSHEEGTH